VALPPPPRGKIILTFNSICIYFFINIGIGYEISKKIHDSFRNDDRYVQILLFANNFPFLLTLPTGPRVQVCITIDRTVIKFQTLLSVGVYVRSMA
jgi:hypothetical protein